MALTESPFVDCVRVYVRNSGGFYPFTPGCYNALRTAWEAGKTFYTGQTIDGDEVTIKLGEVEALMLCTVASQEAGVERGKAEAKLREPESYS